MDLIIALWSVVSQLARISHKLPTAVVQPPTP